MEIKKINIKKNVSKDGTKIYHVLEWGRKKGECDYTGIWIHKKPMTEAEKKHNYIMEKNVQDRFNEQYEILNPGLKHRVSDLEKKDGNFYDYYQTYVDENSTEGRRHLSCSLSAFKLFRKDKPTLFSDITYDLCKSFRDDYLLEKYTGETPAEYFQCFKKVINQATFHKLFDPSPVCDIKGKELKAIKLDSDEREFLTRKEFVMLTNHPCTNNIVKRAALFSLNTGLRWSDVSTVKWNQIKPDRISFKQEKTRGKADVPLNKKAIQVLGEMKKTGLVFPDLPTADGANKLLKQWVRNAGIDKTITWHCLRHSFLTQADGTTQVKANLAGHKSTKQIEKTYNHAEWDLKVQAVNSLPTDDENEIVVVQVKTSDDKIDKRMEYVKTLIAAGYSKDEIKAELATL